MSKKVTRLHGEMGDRAPQRGRNLMRLRPVRSVDSWSVDEETGLVVIRQPKGLSRVEKRLAKAVRAPEHVNRTLDVHGSVIWHMCDGEHTVEQIARAMEDRFHELFEPALPRTLRFVELLARRGLLAVAPVEGEGPTRSEPGAAAVRRP